MPILNCQFCGREYTIWKCLSKKSKYCSINCKAKWQSINNRGINHPNFKEKIVKKCILCDKEYSVNPCRGSGSKYCSRECKDKDCIKLSKKMWDKPDYRKKVTNSLIESWKNKESREQHVRACHRGCKRGINKPEKCLQIILDKHFPNEFKYNGNCELGVVLGGCVPDFVNVNGKKQVIEVFGDYWHDRSNMDWKQTEFGRKTAYSQLGYKCVIIWEHELVNSPRYGKQLTESELVKRMASL